MPQARRLLLAGHVVLLTASTVFAVALQRPGDWQPQALFWLLGTLTLLSGLYQLEYREIKASASFIGVVLAAALLGPLPAMVIAVTAIGVVSVHRRLPAAALLCNLSSFAAFSVAAGAAFRVAEDAGLSGGAGMVFVVLAVFLATNLLNFLVVAIDFKVLDGIPVLHALRKVYVPCLPVEVASALLTATVAFSYAHLGVWVVLVFVAVGLAFQYLLHYAFEATHRGEVLSARTEELASLQVGLLSTVLRTLSLRDKMTARHSAAVARYARAVAAALGLPEREQELIHTAALLHDIGKFVFPDSILLADRKLTDDDFAIVKSHPAAGADLVASIEGYGPVAEIVLAHHERIDGRGYPHGVCGDAIPIGSRIIAVCDTFDVMTSRDSYRQPVSRAEAIAELRRVAGSQLDARIVEVFIALVAEEGIAFRHTDDADFERELDLRRRVEEYARPRTPVAA